MLVARLALVFHWKFQLQWSQHLLASLQGLLSYADMDSMGQELRENPSHTILEGTGITEYTASSAISGTTDGYITSVCSLLVHTIV